MNKHLLKQQLTSYEADYAQWCAEQGALLREGRLSDIDRENLAEEIEGLVRSDKREIRNRLGVLLQHLFKWQLQAEKRKVGWLLTSNEQREQIGNLIDESPSLKSYPKQQLRQTYESSRLRASNETRLPLRLLPEDSPYAIEHVLDRDFFPGAPWSRDELIED